VKKSYSHGRLTLGLKDITLTKYCTFNASNNGRISIKCILVHTLGQWTPEDVKKKTSITEAQVSQKV